MTNKPDTPATENPSHPKTVLDSFTEMLERGTPGPWTTDPGGIRNLLLRDATGKAVVESPRSVAPLILACVNAAPHFVEVARAAENLRDHAGIALSRLWGPEDTWPDESKRLGDALFHTKVALSSLYEVLGEGE